MEEVEKEEEEKPLEEVALKEADATPEWKDLKDRKTNW